MDLWVILFEDLCRCRAYVAVAVASFQLIDEWTMMHRLQTIVWHSECPEGATSVKGYVQNTMDRAQMRVRLPIPNTHTNTHLFDNRDCDPTELTNRY